jgi:hypothetical protein
MMIVLLLFLQKQNLANDIYLFGLGTLLLSRGVVGCAGHGGTTLGAQRDGHVTVAAAEPRSLLNGGVLAHANTVCSHSHQNMSFDEYATRILVATLGGAGPHTFS